jgi:hypothetical protein
MQDADARDGEPHAASLDGNRVWRVETASGPVLQKLYAERGGWLHARLRELATRLRGGKTGTRAASRRATEARLLALWREHGCDVPANISTAYPELCNERTLVLEFVAGPLLGERLHDAALDEGARAALLSAFGATWGRRHRLALARREPGLVQEHGTLDHVIVDGAAGAPRFVTFDHENAFVGEPVEAHVAREVGSVLPSLYRSQPRAGLRLTIEVTDARFRADLRALVAGYGDPAPLRAACERYLRPRSAAWRLVCRLDRARDERRGIRAGKYRLLEQLDAELAPAAAPR